MKTLDRIGFALGHPVRATIVSELLSGGFLPSGELDDAVVAGPGAQLLRDLSVDGAPVGSVAGGCVDLTERRLHLRGPFAKALFRGMCDRGWLVRARELRDRIGIAAVPA
jgi:hypothetical protein